MSTIIKLQAIIGSCSPSNSCAYLLQLDDYRILLDCGWDELLSESTLEQYKRHLSSVDAVLISYPDVHHLGALPYLFGKYGLSCPIYATVPVHAMGLMFMYDLCQSRLCAGYANDFFSLDDVDCVFDSITQLKYCQSVRPTSSRADVVITPLPAGHMIGGTIWRIVKDGDEHILYSVDFNHKPERHLNMCSFEGESGKASAASISSAKHRPALMISDPGKPKIVQQPSLTKRRHYRDTLLLNAISDHLSNDRQPSDCLICSDTAGRVLELLILLDQAWPSLKRKCSGTTKETAFMSCHLVYLSYLGCSIVEFARSLVEWMNDHMSSNFEQSRLNPFRLQNFVICQSMEQLNKLTGHRIILSNGADLESGLARQLFLQICQNENCTIILTLRPSPCTLGARLFDAMVYKAFANANLSTDVASGSGILQCSLKTFSVDIARRVEFDFKDDLPDTIAHLSGIELESVDPVSNEDSPLFDEKLDFLTDHQTEPLKHPSISKNRNLSNYHDDQVTDTTHSNDIIPANISLSSRMCFINTAKKIFPTFPYNENPTKSDDYGEIVDFDNFFGLASSASNNWLRSSGGQTLLVEGKPHDFKDQSSVPTTSCISHTIDNSKSDCNLEDSDRFGQIIDRNCLFHLNARLLFIDFDGRSESESVRRIVKEQRPRNLIVVHGSTEMSEQFVNVCKAQIGEGYCVSPSEGEVVDVTQEKNMIQVYLDGEFAQQLNMSIARDHYHLTWITGQLRRSDPVRNDCIGDRWNCGHQGGLNSKERRLVLKPLCSSVEQRINKASTRQVVFVNDPKLSDLKVALCEQGIRAEFLGGTLMCDNLVAIKRNESGKIILEGTFCETYFNVRSILYSFYAII